MKFIGNIEYPYSFGFTLFKYSFFKLILAGMNDQLTMKKSERRLWFIFAAQFHHHGHPGNYLAGKQGLINEEEIMKKKMLIVDDNENLREALKMVFEDHYDLQFADSGEAAIESFNFTTPEVVLMDFNMPGLNGIQTMQMLREQSEQTQMIIMSAYDDQAQVRSALHSGAFDYVPKPFDVFDLKNLVDQAAANADKIINFNPKPDMIAAKATAFEKRYYDQLIDRSLQAACC